MCFAKKRLRQRIDDIFHNFLEIIIFSWFFQHFLCEKAHAAKNIWHVFMIVHDFLENLIFPMIPSTFCCGNAPAAKNRWHLFMIFNDFLEILIFSRFDQHLFCEKAPAAKNIWQCSWFSCFSRNYHISLVCLTSFWRKGACGKE